MALRTSLVIAGLACCVLFFAAPFADAAEDECSRSPLSIDKAPYNSDTMEVSCEPAETVKQADFDEATKQMADMAPFFRAFMPPVTTVYKTVIGGNGVHYVQAFLIDTKGKISLSRNDLHAALQALAKNNLFGDGAGTVTFGKTVQVSGYEVEFYVQELPKSIVGGGRSNCFSFVRYFDGASTAHRRRILGYYCINSAVGPLDEAYAKEVIATLHYRPERIK
jgi:hypothetical protein